MNKKIAVVVGFIGKIPYAGMSLYNIHHIVGLQDLGYDVHYVELIDYPEQCYDPSTDQMTSDPAYAIGYVSSHLAKYGIADNRVSIIDLDQQCHVSGWTALRESLDRADFVLTLDTPSWSDEFERCPRRAYIDTDPMFNQAEMIAGGIRASLLTHYEVLFTYGMRIGQPGCMIPDAGRAWIPARTVIATRLWEVLSPAAKDAPVCALMHWSGKDAVFEGHSYGHKNREFQNFLDLPQHTSQPFSLAIGGGAPKDKLTELGWDLVSPLGATGTIEKYCKFIADSKADFGIAKHAYVASRSGWFSDRSTCFLASGRPVLHQDTGFGDWLPAGEGVLKFSNVSDVVECLRCLDLDYNRHARAARKMAEEHFEAATVLGQMLDQGGLR